MAFGCFTSERDFYEKSSIMRSIVHGIGDAVGGDPSGIGAADQRGTVVSGRCCINVCCGASVD